MKNLFILITVFISISTFANCENNVRFISDFDDTIKTYRSGFPLFKLGNALFKKNINAGMTELFEGIHKERTLCGKKIDLTILTASLKLFRPSIRSFFKHYQFPPYKLIVRPVTERTLQYKKSRLKQLISQSKSPVILIGDDTSYDAIAYDWAKKTFPKKVIQIYIHSVKGTKPIGSEIKYYSTWEIALHEYQQGRLNLEHTLRVGNKILNSKMKDIIPKYGVCPRKIRDYLIQNSELEKLNNELKERIEKHCQRL